MLKQRLITALILIPVVILLVLKLPLAAFVTATGVLVLMGAWEWSGFMGIKKFPQVLIYPVCMLVLMGLSLYLYIPAVMVFAVFWWLLAIILMFFYPRSSKWWSKSRVLRAIMGVLVLIPCWMAINFIRSADTGAYALLFLFILIWGADSFAYFAGKKWGKHKLAPNLSPGKSWEGFIAALVGGVIITTIALCGFRPPAVVWPGALALSLVTVVFSVMGDLFESMLKRNVGLKDSGNILPGHGGILDRIDSLTAAAPVFVAGILWLDKIYR